MDNREAIDILSRGNPTEAKEIALGIVETVIEGALSRAKSLEVYASPDIMSINATSKRAAYHEAIAQAAALRLLLDLTKG